MLDGRRVARYCTNDCPTIIQEDLMHSERRAKRGNRDLRNNEYPSKRSIRLKYASCRWEMYVRRSRPRPISTRGMSRLYVRL